MSPLLALFAVLGAGAGAWKLSQASNAYAMRPGETWRIKFGIQPPLPASIAKSALAGILVKAPGSQVTLSQSAGMTVIVVTAPIVAAQSLPKQPIVVNLGGSRLGIVVLEAVRLT